METRETQLEKRMLHLRTRLLTMCASTQQALEDSYIALVNMDEVKAHAVIDHDEEIDMMENEIDDMALSILACEQPVASDLRMVVSSLRMVVDLERIADEAVHIAERAILIRGMPFIPDELVSFMKTAVDLFTRATIAFSEGNVDDALRIHHEEANHSQREMAILQTAIGGTDGLFAKEPWTAMYTILIARSINRIIRRASNIAEHTYFAHAGHSLKHIRKDQSCS